MNLIRKVATTLALCGATFFTNMAHAGDCGEWVTGGFWRTGNVYVDGVLVSSTEMWIDTVEWEPGACPTQPEPVPEPEPQSRSQQITAALSNFTLSCRQAGLSQSVYTAGQVAKCTDEVYSAVEADLWAFGPWKWWVKVGIANQCTTKVSTEIAFSYNADFQSIPVCN